MQSYTSNWQKVAEKYPYTPKKQLVKKQGHAHVKKQGGLYY